MAVLCAVACVAAVLMSFGVWMVCVEPRRFRIWRCTVPRVAQRGDHEVSVLAERLPPLSILHISDSHFGVMDRPKLRFVRRVARQPYDLVFLTGDLVDRPCGLKECLELAELLAPRLGAFAVLGGHDHFRGIRAGRRCRARGNGAPSPPRFRRRNPVGELKKGLRERGVEVLEDESRTIRCPGGAELAIVGLRDAFVFQPDYEAAWREVPRGAPTIVLAHSPDVLPEVLRRAADMAFFGHTHGGQVRLPLVGALVTRSRIGRRRARGVFREGPTVFSLNDGLGAGRGTGFRLLCRPEVTLMVLDPGSGCEDGIDAPCGPENQRPGG